MKKRIILLVTILLAGCLSTPSLWGFAPAIELQTTATFTEAPIEAATSTSLATFTPTSSATPLPTATEFPSAIQRVMIVSFDGLRGDAVEAAPMTNVMKMMEAGAYTLTAHTINWSVTLPSHASMLSGMCMEKHGVNWNGLLFYKGYSKGIDLFDLTHAAGMKSLMIVGKAKLQQIAEPHTLDILEIYATEAAIGDAVVAQIPSGFDLMFVHFPGPDVRGHKHGWMSNAQMKVLREGDAALGQILDALDEAGLSESTLIIVTADHGGHDRIHDGTLQVDYDIPWIATGPGIIHKELSIQVETMDTAATAAHALDLPIPDDWDGLPVYEAFGLPAEERFEEVCP